MSIIIFIIILLVLVVVHEFGHFFVAKRFGIRVDEFGFGFPPKLLGKKFGETEYTVNLVPLGGFVKIFGENPDEEGLDGPDKERSFIAKPKWQQALVLFAGVFMNFILAWFLFSIGFMSGLPTSAGSNLGGGLTDVHLTVISVVPNSPAEKAGLKPGDKITDIYAVTGTADDKYHITDPTPEELKNFIASYGARFNIVLGLDGIVATPEELSPSVNIKPDVLEGKPQIGITMDEIGIAKMGFFGAIGQGFVTTCSLVKSTVLGLYGLIRNALAGQGSLAAVTGPVGLVSVTGQAYKFGFSYLLSFAALISINLAIINLVPFPALDGGRLFFLLIEKIKGSPISPKVANTANTVGFALLIFLMLFITYHDVIKLF